MAIPARADIVVIGGGIAGLSAGWALADRSSVIVLEQEAAIATHATGRSAAVISETYGGIEICALAAASRPFLADPPTAFTEVPLLRDRGMLWVSDIEGALDAVAATAGRLGVRNQRLNAEDAQQLVPVIRAEWMSDALLEPDAMSIDVAALTEGFRRGLRARGGRIETSSAALGLEPVGGDWQVTTANETIQCDVVINAAGAWADDVARLAGIDPLGLQPLRRTAFLFPTPNETGGWPLVMDGGGRFYFEPEGDGLLTSPADETPMDAHDARADDMAIAMATDALASATTLVVRGVRQRWAGLRTFAPDRLPVVGFEPHAPGFFWLAGQGGGGIKTSPALAALTRALVLGGATPHELNAVGLDPDTLTPRRLRA